MGALDMTELPLERILYISLIERLLQTGVLGKDDLVGLRDGSMRLIIALADSTDTAQVDAAYKRSSEVDQLFEGFLRVLDKRA